MVTVYRNPVLMPLWLCSFVFTVFASPAAQAFDDDFRFEAEATATPKGIDRDPKTDLKPDESGPSGIRFQFTVGGARETSTVAPPYDGRKSANLWSLGFAMGLPLAGTLQETNLQLSRAKGFLGPWTLAPHIDFQLQYPLSPNDSRGRPNLNYDLRPGLKYEVWLCPGCLESSDFFLAGFAGYGFGKLQFANANVSHYGPFVETEGRWESGRALAFVAPWEPNRDAPSTPVLLAPAISVAASSQVPVTKFAAVDAVAASTKEGYKNEVVFVENGDAWANEIRLKVGVVSGISGDFNRQRKSFFFLGGSFAEKGFRGLVRKYPANSSTPLYTQDASRQAWSAFIGIERL